MDIVNSILFLVFCGITSIALLTVLNLLMPVKVERVREKLEGHYVRSFVIGIIALGLSSAILLLLFYIINLPIYGIEASVTRPIFVTIIHQLIPEILTLLAIVIGVGVVIISIIGLAALAKSIGQRIGNLDKSTNPNLIGATLLVLSGLFPFLGWFIFAPVAFCIGYGSTIRALFQRKTALQVLE
jgi:hypothetical protein